jgi:hypothetical protein
MPRPLKIDHVTLASSRLDTLRDAFAQIGLATTYGGMHSNGITHMSLLGFDDGSYIELISTLTTDASAPWWRAHIAANAGPCGWSIEVEDVSAEVSRLSMLGVPVSGPTYHHRKRPDGTLVEWDLASVGEGEIGTVHPFVIKDRTPRQYRVSPTPSVSGSELTGAVIAVIGVVDLEPAIATFRRTYGLPKPRTVDSAHLLARLAVFDDQPLVLATPLDRTNAFADRLAQLGDSPIAFLIGTKDFQASKRRFPFAAEEQWAAGRIGWFRHAPHPCAGLGIVEIRT